MFNFSKPVDEVKSLKLVYILRRNSETRLSALKDMVYDAQIESYEDSNFYRSS